MQDGSALLAEGHCLLPGHTRSSVAGETVINSFERT